MIALRARREVLRLATVIFDAAVFYVGWASLSLLISPATRLPPFGLVLGLTAYAVYVARYLDLGQPGENRQSWAIMGAALVSLLVAAWLLGLGGPWQFLLRLRNFEDIAVILFVAHFILWWRAISTVSDGFSAERTGFRFRLGVVILFWALLFDILVDFDPTPYIFLFFTASLLAMSLARVEDVTLDLHGVATPFDATWTAILALAVLAVMTLGLVVVLLLPAETVRIILGWFAPLWSLILALFLGLVYIVLLILNPLIEALINALRPSLDRLQLPTPVPTAGPGEQNQPPPAEILPPLVTESLRWLALAAALGVAIWLIGVWGQRRRDAHTAPIPELRESVWSADAFAQDARDLLGRALGRFRGNRRALSTENIRRIYASLQAVAAERGVPRPPEATPYEYLPDLVDLLPQAEVDLRLLTQAYVDAHYHELPVSEADLTRAREAWRRVQRALAQAPAKAPAAEAEAT